MLEEPSFALVGVILTQIWILTNLPLASLSNFEELLLFMELLDLFIELLDLFMELLDLFTNFLGIELELLLALEDFFSVNLPLASLANFEE